MPRVAEEELQEIIETARDTYSVRKILLYGSYARGDAHDHSDLNLCIIVAADSEKPLEEWPAKSWLYRAADVIQRIFSAEVAVNPYVVTEGEFDALRDREHPLVGQILQEGRVVYEQ
jgi:predicted nucleotidyltransferase